MAPWHFIERYDIKEIGIRRRQCISMKAFRLPVSDKILNEITLTSTNDAWEWEKDFSFVVKLTNSNLKNKKINTKQS